MNRLAILSTAVLTTLGAASCAPKAQQAVTLPDTDKGIVQPLKMSDDAAPATQPAALPDGHPAIGGQMPAGHPPVGGGQPGGMPDGHPPIGGAQQGQSGAALPSGHPEIQQMMPKKDAKPIDVTFNIQALQQTKDAKAVGSLPASIEFILGEETVGQKLSFILDEKGAASVPAKAVPTGAVGYITVTYQGVDYHAVSAPVDATRPQTKVGIGVFESTDLKPAWNVAMQHVILSPSPNGLQVMEMISVENPTDRSWLGGTPGADGKRTTVTFPVPPTSGDIQPIQGFKDGFVKLDGDVLVNQLPLTPGPTQYRLTYTIPYNNGKAAMSYKTTSPVKHMMVFVPDDGTQAEVKGLQSLGQQDMNGKKIRAFMGMNLSEGAPIDLVVSQPTGSSAAPSVRESSMPAVSGGAHLETTAGVPQSAANFTVQIAKAVAVAGTVLVLLLAGALMFAKPNRAAKK